MTHEIRRLPEAEAIARWAELYDAAADQDYVRVLGSSQYQGEDDTWVEVEISHDLYAADWNADGADLSSRQIELAGVYARRSGPLPPGMASFQGRCLPASKKACVIDGNHRAHASFLRGELSARFFMPACDWERFLVVIGT